MYNQEQLIKIMDEKLGKGKNGHLLEKVTKEYSILYVRADKVAGSTREDFIDFVDRQDLIPQASPIVPFGGFMESDYTLEEIGNYYYLVVTHCLVGI